MVELLQQFSEQPLWGGTIFLSLVLLGGCVGLLAGLFGIGGGIILVPSLTLLFHLLGLDPDNTVHIAVATSLATIMPTSLASLRAHHRRGGIDWPLMRQWCIWLMLGGLCGSVITQYLSGKIIQFLFGILLAFMIWRFLKPASRQNETAHPIAMAWQRLLALSIGTSASMLGIGGGALGVPVLNHLGLPLRRAIGTASCFGIIVATPSVISYLLASPPITAPLGGTIGLVHPLIFALLIPGSIVGASFGAKLAHRLPIAKLRYGFTFLLALLCIKMFYSSLT